MRKKNKSLEPFYVANKMHILGPQHREFRKEILQTMQVGVGPQHREFRKEILQTMQVGVGPQHKEILFL
ncbi:hypothetical protein E3K14_03785 [Staphylococcus aureus]|nr:hypothetical protein E3K14_03785 [Staphylococcus aureus]